MILSRSFCNTCIITDLKEIRSVFENGVQAIREQEKECETYARYFRDNERIVAEKVRKICQNR